jgi:hypothetical protein
MTTPVSDIAMALASKQPRAAQEAFELGQEARTKELYIKSLVVQRGDDETEKSWCDRGISLAAYLLEHMPADPRQNGEGK